MTVNAVIAATVVIAVTVAIAAIVVNVANGVSAANVAVPVTKEVLSNGKTVFPPSEELPVLG